MSTRSKFGVQGGLERINRSFGPGAPSMEVQNDLRNARITLGNAGNTHPTAQDENAIIIQQAHDRDSKERLEHPFDWGNIGRGMASPMMDWMSVMNARAPGGIKPHGGPDPMSGLASDTEHNIAVGPTSFNTNPDIPGNVNHYRTPGMTGEQVIGGLRAYGRTIR